MAYDARARNSHHNKIELLLTMRLHAAVWKFAQDHGSQYARSYAAKHLLLSVEERMESDNKWILRRGGVSLRKTWLHLSMKKRQWLMALTPDSGFPAECNGIIDERHQRAVQRRSPQLVNPQVPHSPLGDFDVLQPDRVPSFTRTSDPSWRALVKSRSNYYKVAGKEALVQLQIHYNRGSLAGSLEAVVQSVEAAVQLARVQDKPSTVLEAFEATVARLSDVFASVRGTAAFEPDPFEELPSESYSTARITKARDAYVAAVQQVTQDSQNPTSREQIGPPLLPAHYRSFRRVVEMPTVAQRFNIQT